MSSVLERGLTVTLCISAVTLAGSVAWREFAKEPQAATNALRSPKPEYIPGWEESLSVGIRVGETSAGIAIVAFSDLECRPCARFHAVIEESLAKYSKDIALIFVHMPLEGHRFALQAARAAECADRSGRFVPMLSAIYGKQDSIGLKSWGSFALEAGISDSASISTCAWDTSSVHRIEAGKALAEKLGVRGTPTVLVNGWLFLGPSKDELERAIEAVLSGKTPAEVGKE
jgi:protein-disulfide isomerase